MLSILVDVLQNGQPNAAFGGVLDKIIAYPMI
jgi:hypothetical protein